MNTDEISKAIKGFVKKHRNSLYQLSKSQSKALEFASAIGVADHYSSNGYSISVINPGKQNVFKVKESTKGYPWNFSRVILSRDTNVFEMHMNLSVRSAHDDGVYCIDVGVCKEGDVPNKRTESKWIALENSKLITFAEAKSLVVYPMLLAHFIGIVHEIKPSFIGGRLQRGFKANDHLYPTLISLGSFSATSQKIVNAYKQRKIRVVVAENYLLRLAYVRGGHYETPFYVGDLDGN